MFDNLILLLSGFLILISNVPYAIRIWQGKINPSLATWVLYTSIGFVVLISFDFAFYEKEKTGQDFLEEFFVICGFIDSVIISILISKKQNKTKKPFSKRESNLMVCVFIILFFWIFIQNNKEWLLYSLMASILMEVLATMPQLEKIHKNPEEDRPIPWLIYAVGYFLPVFALTNKTQWVLPIVMSVLYVCVAIPLINYRIRNKIPFKDWI